MLLLMTVILVIVMSSLRGRYDAHVL